MPPERVVMVGTALETRGGISAVVGGWRQAGFFQRWPVDYVESHRDGGRVAKGLKALEAFAAFAALLVRHRRAVLHVHAASRASFWRKAVFMALALAVRWPIVFHLHGGGFATFYAEECGPLRRALVRFFLDRAASLVVVSGHWRAWIGGVTRNPAVFVVPNGVPLPAAGAAPREPATVFFAGRVSESKGIYDLLQATLALRRPFPELRVECAGDGDLDEVERAAASMGLADRVRMLGWIGARRREDFLARATVVVLPSHAEGLPMSLLEAMAAGCPVVASRVGGIPDVVRDGENGLLVAPGDVRALERAIARLLGDPALAARLGEAARETIARAFTREAALAGIESVYRSLGVRAARRAAAPTRNRVRRASAPRAKPSVPLESP